MEGSSAVLQVCTTCRRASENSTFDPDAPVEGQLLLDALAAGIDEDEILSKSLHLQPVECMNNCQLACTVAVRSEGKFNFVIGELDSSSERVEDILSFAKSYIAAENGSPAWRERPEHVRKNTIARLHPLSEPTK